MLISQKKLTLAITLALASIISNAPSLLAALPVLDTGTPNGNRTPGGTRPGKIISCLDARNPSPNEADELLTALTPTNAKGLTVSEYPTFWFYIPYDSKDISSIEFSLRDYEPREEKPVYETALTLSKTPGIISIALPTEKKYSIGSKNRYHWHLKLNCKSKQKSEGPDLSIDGWVQMVTPTSAQANEWYDRLDKLAKLHFANLQDVQQSSAWTNLLESVGLKELAQKPKATSMLSTQK